MSRIKILITAILAVCVLSSASIAQVPAKNKLAARQGQGIVKQLGLTQDQIAQIREIAKKYHADVKNVRQSNATAAEKKNQVATLRQGAIDAINAVLTPEQRDKAIQNKFAERYLQPKARKAGMLKMLEKLNLTEAQKAEIKSITQDTNAKIKAVNADTSLTADAKKTQIKAIREESQQKIKALLTPEQQQQLQDMMSKRQGAKGSRTK